TPPTPPVAFSPSWTGSARVSEVLGFTVLVHANAPIDADAVLSIPGGVESPDPLARPVRLAAGEETRVGWRLSSALEGFWSAQVSLAGASTSLFAFSNASVGFAGFSQADAIPPAHVDSRLAARVVNGSSFAVEFGAAPRDDWMQHARLVAWIVPDSTWRGPQQAVRVPNADAIVVGDLGGVARSREDVPFEGASREASLTTGVEVQVRFASAQDPEPAAQIEIACENHRLRAVGGNASEVQQWPCTQKDPNRRYAPAEVLLPAALIATLMRAALAA